MRKREEKKKERRTWKIVRMEENQKKKERRRTIRYPKFLMRVGTLVLPEGEKMEEKKSMMTHC